MGKGGHHQTAENQESSVENNQKQNCKKDLVVTKVLILGAACTHPLIPPVLSNDHPLSTNQTPMDRAKVQDP